MRFSLLGRGLALAGVVVALAFACAVAARAEGDPAAESLQTRNIFTPSPQRLDTLPQRRLLKKNVERVYAAHQRIRVAVIARASDLETFPQYFRKPQAYARFVGKEIAQFYRGPLLIVMPNGFGIYDGGRPTDAEERVLANLKVRNASTAALIASAARAVNALFRAGALASKDTVAPRVYAMVAFGRPGKTVTIRYHVLEDSQESSEVVTVLDGNQPLATLLSPFKAAVYKNAHTVKYQLPSPAPSDLRYCVVATDRSGNSSEQACMPIMLRG